MKDPRPGGGLRATHAAAPGRQLRGGQPSGHSQRLLSPRRWAACSSPPPASCTRPPRAPPMAWNPLCPASPRPPTPPRTSRLPTRPSSSKVTSDGPPACSEPEPALGTPKTPSSCSPEGPAPRRCSPSSEVPLKISQWILGEPKQGSPVPKPRRRQGDRTRGASEMPTGGGGRPSLWLRRRGAPRGPHGARPASRRPRKPRRAPRGVEREPFPRRVLTEPAPRHRSAPAVTPRPGTGTARMGVCYRPIFCINTDF